MFLQETQGSKPSETTSCEANRLTKNQGHSDKHSHPTTLQYQQVSHHKRWRLSEQVACFRKGCNLRIKITDQCRKHRHRKGTFSHSIHRQKIPSTCVQIGARWQSKVSTNLLKPSWLNHFHHQGFNVCSSDYRYISWLYSMYLESTCSSPTLCLLRAYLTENKEQQNMQWRYRGHGTQFPSNITREGYIQAPCLTGTYNTSSEKQKACCSRNRGSSYQGHRETTHSHTDTHTCKPSWGCRKEH